MTPRKFPAAPRKHQRLGTHGKQRALCIINQERIDLDSLEYSSCYPRVNFAIADEVIEIPAQCCAEGSQIGLRGVQQLSAAKANNDRERGEASGPSGLGQLTAGRHEAVRLRIEKILNADDTECLS